MSYCGGRIIYIDSDGNEHLDSDFDDYGKKTQPQTNADRIRAMSDEELATVFTAIAESYWKPYQGWLNWLKAEGET